MVYNLDAESIWVDEGISIRLAQFSPSQIVVERASNIHPPFYFIVLRYWVDLFGDSEFSARLLSVIFGVLAVFMIYKVGKLIFNQNVGILASLLLAFSVFHVGFSQEVRGYSLMAFLTLFSMFCFVRLFEKWSTALSIAYVLSSALLLYTHVFGSFVLVAQNAYWVMLLLLSKEDHELGLKRWVLLQVVITILFAPWIGVLWAQVFKVQSGFWIPAPSLRAIAGSLKRYSGSVFLLPIFLVLASFSMVTYERNRDNIRKSGLFKSVGGFRWGIRSRNEANLLLMVWFLTPIVLPFIISQFSTPIYITRATISASLAFYLFVAKGIDNINERSARPVITGVIVLLSLLGLGNYYREVNNEQWRDVALHVDQHANQGDLLLFNAGFCQENAFDYYSTRTDLIKRPFPEATQDIFYFATVDNEDIDGLIPIVQGHERVWVILSHSRDRQELITEKLGEFFNISDQRAYVGIEVYAFEE
jgi:uncharacterized membrane protein